MNLIGKFFTDFERRFQRIRFDKKVYGAQFSFTPGVLPNRTILTKTISYSFGALGFNGKNIRGQMFNAATQYRAKHFNFQVESGIGNFNILNPQNNERLKGFGTGISVRGSYTPWKILTVQGNFEKYSPNFSSPQRSSRFSDRSGEGINFIANPLGNLVFRRRIFNNEYTGFSLLTNQREKITAKNFDYSIAYDPPWKIFPRISFSLTTTQSSAFGKFTTRRLGLAREFHQTPGGGGMQTTQIIFVITKV